VAEPQPKKFTTEPQPKKFTTECFMSWRTPRENENKGEVR
jgi:hypothetical protein